MHAPVLVIIGIAFTVLGGLAYVALPALTGYQLGPVAEATALLALMTGLADTTSGLAADII